jgi:hypothetical protein
LMWGTFSLEEVHDGKSCQMRHIPMHPISLYLPKNTRYKLRLVFGLEVRGFRVQVRWFRFRC